MGAPNSNIEREAKLDAGMRFELPDLSGIVPGVTATRLPDAKLQAIYVDTADLRLMRWGVTLRHRRDGVGGAGAESEWTVKLPGEADGVALVRTELSWSGPFGSVPSEVASLVRAYARTARLVPVAKLLSERHRVELRDSEGQKLGEVDDDVVSVMDGRKLAARFRQVEVEITEAAPNDLLGEVMRVLTTAGAVAGDDRPKVHRAIGPRAALRPDVVVPPLDSRSTVATVVSAAIEAGATRIIRHDPGVRLGDDPEHVHQARVGTRRLRSDLRTFRSLLDPAWTAAARAELGWLAAMLGEVRDADVLTGRLRGQIRSLPGVDAKAAAALLRRLATQREDARVRLLEALDSDRYLVLLENLTGAAANPPWATQQRGPASEAPAVPPLGTAGDGLFPVPVPTGSPGASPATEGPAASPDGNGSSTGWAAGGNGSARRAPVPRMTAAVGGSPPDVSSAPTTAQAPGLAPTPVPAPAPAPDVSPAPTPTLAPALATGSTMAMPLPVPNPTDATTSVAAVTPELIDRCAAEVLPALVRGPWKHLHQAVEVLGEDPPDEALHEIRILAKRMRYAAEAVSGVVGKPARQLASAVAAVQEVLGEMQDAVVAEAWLRGQAGSSPPSRALVAGELITLERQQQAACRRDWLRPWKAASKKSLRRWLKG